MVCSSPDSSVHGIYQGRILEWVAFPPPGDLTDPGTEPRSAASLALQMDSLPLSHLGSPCSSGETNKTNKSIHSYSGIREQANG